MDESNLDTEEEILPLDLTVFQASILWINCNRSITQYSEMLISFKIELGKSVKERELKLTDDELRQQISELGILIKITKELGIEIGEIVKELDVKENTSKTIIKPNWLG